MLIKFVLFHEFGYAYELLIIPCRLLEKHLCLMKL